MKRPDFYRGEHDDFIRKLYQEEPVEQRGDFALCLEEEFGLTAAQAKEALKYFRVPVGIRIADLYAEELADAENSGVRYYRDGDGIYRVIKHTYEYLDFTTGEWVAHPSVVDSVIFEPGTDEIAESEAKILACIRAPDISPIWLDVSGDDE